MWGARCADSWRLRVTDVSCTDADAVGKTNARSPEAPFSVNEASEEDENIAKMQECKRGQLDEDSMKRYCGKEMDTSDDSRKKLAAAAG